MASSAKKMCFQCGQSTFHSCPRCSAQFCSSGCQNKRFNIQTVHEPFSQTRTISQPTDVALASNSSKFSVQDRLKIKNDVPLAISNMAEPSGDESSTLNIPVAYQFNRVQKLQQLLQTHLANKITSSK